MMEYNELEGCLGIKSEDEIKKENGCDGMMPSDEIEVKPFVDKSCNRETNHMIIESGLYQDVKSALNQETNVMRYHELEECLGIKSEGEVKKEEDECGGDAIPHDDTEIKPIVNNSYNPVTNQTTIPCENTSATEMRYLKYGELIEGVEVITYFCKFCSYEAKLKEDLTKHMLDHKDISELTTYQCEQCPYKTQRKGHLTRHMLVHRDTTYQCQPPYHTSIHQNISEVTAYQCNFCPYMTKRKGDLSRHVRIHQDTSDVTTYQCKYCPYKTKWKGYLSTHALIHQDASEITTYDCTICSYKAKRKIHITRHVLIHRDASEVPSYQCKLCPYKAKRKEYLSRHALVHRDRTFECKFCSYTANKKVDFVTHMLSEHNIVVTQYDAIIKKNHLY